MDKKIYALKCRGQLFPKNIIDEIYFTWKLSGCKTQNYFRLTILDGDEVLFSVEKKTDKQVCYIDNISLKPLTQYTYKVTVETDSFTDTAVGYFRSGLVNGFDSRASWISDGRVLEGSLNDDRAVYLRKIFFLGEAPKTAEAFVCGLGMYEFFLNGKRVGDKVLEPVFSDYGKRVYYSSYSVENLLQEGENCIEIVLANGWYNQTTKDSWGFHKIPWRDCPKLLFQMNYGNQVLCSDLSWQYSFGPICFSRVRGGEFHDFTIKKEWKKVSLAIPPKGKLYATYMPPIKECEVLTPVYVKEFGDYTLYDFGKNITGYCAITLEGIIGEECYIKYSDRLTDNHIDNRDNGQYIKESDWPYQTDACRLAGGYETLKASFTYHGFQYVEVKTTAVVKEIKAFFVHTNLSNNAKFSSSSKVLNGLYQMSLNSILGNYQGFPTDCPHREKNGWTGDAQLSLETCLYNFDMLESYRKWIMDIIDTQTAEGQISVIAPTSGYGYGCWPAWEIALYRIPLACYECYGDIQLIKKIYPYLKKHFYYINDTYKKDNLIEYGLGDFKYPKNIRFDVCPQELTNSLNFMEMGNILSKLALYIGEENAFYEKTAELIKQAILSKYENESSLTGMAGLTYFNIVDKTQNILDYLSIHNYQLHCGILGSKYLFDVLGKSEQLEILYKILTNTDYPSFGYWWKNRMTTLSENFEMSESLNHHMYSFIVEYIIKYFAGVVFKNQMKTIVLNPYLPKAMDDLHYEKDTIYGRFVIDLKRMGDKTILNINVPHNTEVFIHNEKYTSGYYSVKI